MRRPLLSLFAMGAIKSLLFVIAFGGTLTAFAAPVRLGPEVPISPAVFATNAIDPQLARSGAHVLAAWWLVEPVSSIEAWIDGKHALTATSAFAPKVAGGAHSFLVVWLDKDRNLVACRLSADGTIDAQPVAIASDVFPPATLYQIADVSFDGSRYIVLWTADRVIHGVHIAETGEQVEPINDVVPSLDFDFIQMLRSVATAQGSLIAYSATPDCGPLDPGMCLAGFRPFIGTATSRGVDSMPSSRALISDMIREQSFDAVTTPYGVAFGWVAVSEAGTALAVVLTDGEGQAVTATRQIAKTCYANTDSGPRLAWDGATIVVTWTEANCDQPQKYLIRAMRLDRSLEPIDPAPFEVAADVLSVPPAIVATENGVKIAYSELDPAVGARIFARDLDRIDYPARRRVVRH